MKAILWPVLALLVLLSGPAGGQTPPINVGVGSYEGFGVALYRLVSGGKVSSWQVVARERA